MQAVYHGQLDELSDHFIADLKKQFVNAQVDIVIREADETSDDQKANIAHLQKLIDEGLASGVGKASMQELMIQAKSKLGYA